MKKVNFLKTSMAIAILLTLNACTKNADKSANQPSQVSVSTEKMISENGANPDEASVRENVASAGAETNSSVSQNRIDGHYLYTESNGATSNAIEVFRIKGNGSLYYTSSTISGGTGTGVGLGSQSALTLDYNHDWLFAVNAGSNSVSSFKVNDDGSLTLAHTQKSGGVMPNSVTVHGQLLYVLNHGSDNISGYWIGTDGSMTHIEGSTKHLSSTMVDAPQISFSPDGSWIIVTEKATNVIGTYKVNSDGSVHDGIFTTSVGPTPFGFDFSRGKFMVVSNAAGGAVGAGSATSYTIGNSGVPDDVNGAIPDYQAAPCWFAVTKYGRFAYTTNTAGNNISSYYISEWGALYLAQAVASTTDAGPVDIVIAANNYFVYELNGKAGTIGGYCRKLMGGLQSVSSTSGLSLSATGLATF